MGKKGKQNLADNKEKNGIFPVNLSAGNPILEMYGNREINIEGVKGVLEYDVTIIRINTGHMIISFYGRGLAISCLTSSSLTIKGFINKIEFLH